jgi:Flp pilus assembly protein TadD
VTNLLLHIANTLLLFGLLHRMTGALGRSAFVAGLFALHPLHVESVAWVTERKDVLSTFFGLHAMWAYVAWVRRPSRERYIGVVLLLALSLMAKPMLVTLPLLLLLLDFWPLGRVAAGAGRDLRATWLRLVREKLPLFAVVLVSSIVTFVAQRSGGAVADLSALPLSFRVTNALVSYVTYIGKTFWPARLAAFYPLPKSLSGWSILGAILALAVVSMLVMRATRRFPYLPVGWLWYLVTLVPVIGLIQVGRQALADRFTYVPLIGLFVIVAWGIPDLLAGWPTRRIPLAAAAGFILMGYAIAARGQVQSWKDSTSLWTHALEVTTDNAVAHNNLARILFLQGNFDEAVAHYTEALRLIPDDADAHNNLANALAHHGRVVEAFAHYSEALRIKPGFAEAHNNLANALARQGRVAEALTHYSEALRIKPDYAEAHNGFGALLAGQGRSGEALAHYSEAVHIDPNYAEAHNNMGALLLGQGKTDEAIREFSEAVRINPAKPEFHYNLGVVLKNKRQINEALGQFNAALRLNPSYQDARHALDTLEGGSSIPTPANR